MSYRINNYNITYDDALNMVANMEGGETTTYALGTMAFIMTCTVLVFLMVPGLGFFYSGLLRQKNASAMLFFCLSVYAVAAITWFFWGYSLALSDTGSNFIGDLKYFGFINVLEQPVGAMPALQFALYQMQFACVTSVIMVGAFAERARLAPVLLFVFCWITAVYCFLVSWVWGDNGWAGALGDLDFAGGGPVHMSSGVAALAVSIFLGRRRGYGTELLAYRPQNIGYIVLGTSFLWIGWIGFNGGSALAMDLVAVQATIVTIIAGAMGGLTWMFIDAIKTHRYSTVSFCSGVIAGLVGITPGAGYVATPSALAIGFITAVFSNLSTYLGHLLGYDDTLDIFSAHGVSGFVGAVLTALFAEAKYANLFEGASQEVDSADGGWVSHHWVQLGYNLAAAVACCAWSFVITFVLLFAINFIPGMKFRASEDDEIVGIDLAQSGEHLYGSVPVVHQEEGRVNSDSEKHSGTITGAQAA